MRNVILIAASCLAMACAKSSGPSAGSQTHFLESCVNGCAAPYDCICGVCTLECTAEQSCGSHSGQAACLVLAADSGPRCTSQAERVCDLACKNDAVCAALGGDFECREGRCREVLASEDPADARASDAADAGDSGAGTNPWLECGGANGTPLSCDSFGARPLGVSRYDRERQCFEPAAQLPELCGVPTFCPGGTGELLCLVSPEGEPYAGHVLFGEARCATR